MIETKQLGSLEYLVCQDIPVPHCFTTRLGGISSGYLSSLNIGTSRGDDPANVIENYRRLGDALGFDIHNLVLSRQTHSDIVYTATEKDRGAGLSPALPWWCSPPTAPPCCSGTKKPGRWALPTPAGGARSAVSALGW